MRGKKYESYADALLAYVAGTKIQWVGENGRTIVEWLRKDGAPQAQFVGEHIIMNEVYPMRYGPNLDYYEHLPDEEKRSGCDECEVLIESCLNLEKERDELKGKLASHKSSLRAAAAQSNLFRERLEQTQRELADKSAQLFQANLDRVEAEPTNPEQGEFAEVDSVIFGRYSTGDSFGLWAAELSRAIVAEAVRQMRRDMATLHDKYGAEVQNGIARDIVSEMAKHATKWEEVKE